MRQDDLDQTLFFGGNDTDDTHLLSLSCRRCGVSRRPINTQRADGPPSTLAKLAFLRPGPLRCHSLTGAVATSQPPSGRG